MKRLSCFLAILFLATTVLALSTTVASAQSPYPSNSQYQQQPIARPTGGNIAVLDMSRVFNEHIRLKSLQKTMEGKVKEIDANLKKENDMIRDMTEGLREYNIGTPEYTQLDGEIVTRKSQLQARVQLERKNLLLQEAQMLHSVYTEIAREVEAIANARGLLMVVQDVEVQSDPNNPGTVKQTLNKQVIWRNKSIDITDEVIARVNRGASNYGTANRPTNNPVRHQIR